MKKFKTTHALLSLIAIVLIGLSAFSFNHSKKKIRTDWTYYYWFDSYGTYLHQNFIDNEIYETGYDEFAYAPYTIQERGYTPATVSGTNPPVPNQPYNPAKRLYSHP